MNSFQILDSNNKPIPIVLLDESAAIFWNQPVHSKQYANPGSSGNWYDVIGFNIAYQGNFTSGWNNIKLAIMSTEMEYFANLILEGKNHKVTFQDVIDNYKPHFDLIDHWKSLGYTPKQIKE